MHVRDVGCTRKPSKGRSRVPDLTYDRENHEILLQTDKETLDESVGIVLKRLQEMGYL
jgi:hypothetical protein